MSVGPFVCRRAVRITLVNLVPSFFLSTSNIKTTGKTKTTIQKNFFCPRRITGQSQRKQVRIPLVYCTHKQPPLSDLFFFFAPEFIYTNKVQGPEIRTTILSFATSLQTKKKPWRPNKSLIVQFSGHKHIMCHMQKHCWNAN